MAAAPHAVTPAPCSQGVAGQSVLLSGNELFVYACKIEETTNGCRRCACSEARQTFQVVAQGSFAEHVQVDGQSRAAQNGEDQAQGKADTEAQEEVALTLQVALLARHPIAPPSEQMRR